jgi:hypothetical protein
MLGNGHWASTGGTLDLGGAAIEVSSGNGGTGIDSHHEWPLKGVSVVTTMRSTQLAVNAAACCGSCADVCASAEIATAQRVLRLPIQLSAMS